MKRCFGILLFLVFVFAVPAALADATPVTMTFVGVNGINDGAYYVSPYTGNMSFNGQSSLVTLFCDDFNNDVTWNQVWQANVTPLSSSDLSNTRYGNPQDVALLLGTDPYYGTYSAAQLYAQAAWLTTQFNQYMLTNPAEVIALQYAIWDLFDANAPTNSAAQAWILLAEQNSGSVDLNNFEIVTNVGPLRLTGQVQEFIVPTPEPATFALLSAALLAMIVFGRRRAAGASGHSSLA
ncbi:MAG: PEP-CTERM sorting domain-containing protein [Candidatus Acidiferrales bacterium]